MPFGRKADSAGSLIDFDRVYADLIAPGVAAAELEPLRADEETVGGIIHKPMFERLILCPYAVADLTLANANVFYELGIRHAYRPWSTVPIVAEGQRLPFDVQMLRTVHYKLTKDGVPDEAAAGDTRHLIARLLTEARKGKKDSPLFQLLTDLQEPVVPNEETDAFRERVEDSNRSKSKLAAARRTSADAVRAVEGELGKIADVESGVVIDLFLSYRARESWEDMVALVGKMSPPLAETVMVREQLGLALNRLERRDEAEEVLQKLIRERGPTSETLGILGRIYKDRWEAAVKSSDDLVARGYLEQAIETYLRGFETDWRDPFPGVNAATLIEILDPMDARRQQILPVVRYAADRKIASGKPDYWAYATLLEVAVVETDQAQAAKILPRALAAIKEPFEPETTIRNLRLIREAREKRGSAPAWANRIEEALSKKAS
jgi:tetratricopeptide (TPR) repeat protein